MRISYVRVSRRIVLDAWLNLDGGICIAFTSVSPRMGANGWPFANVDAFPEAGVDPINNAEHVKDLYLAVDPHYDGR